MEMQWRGSGGQRAGRECVTPRMTAFVTLAGVYNTPDESSDFGVERSRDPVSYTHLTLPTILLV